MRTAVSNDYDYSQVFSRQIEAWALPGDIVIGLSTSGISPYVLEALQVAKGKGAIRIGFCGQNTQQMAGLTDICLAVPSEDTARIQEIHMVIGHIVCYRVEQVLIGASI